jgi:FkbH-like protein
VRRASFYKENLKRKDCVSKFENYADYLQSLEMKAEVSVFKEIYLERIFQLINKTNQFNLTTQRVSMSEVIELGKSDKHICLSGRLQDKFGDNGLITVVIAEVLNQEALITHWLMSCRVLKRDMEKLMLDTLVKACQEKSIYKLIGKYIPSAKNALVEPLYAELGFHFQKTEGDTHYWALNLLNYKVLNVHIGILNE